MQPICEPNSAQLKCNENCISCDTSDLIWHFKTEVTYFKISLICYNYALNVVVLQT